MTQTPLQPPITLDRWPHPLTTEGRETRLRPLSPATPTLAALIARERAVFNAAAPIAAVNGRVIPEADWAGVRLVGGEIVTLRARVSGGGDSDPLAVVLQIAVMAARFYIPGLPAFANLGSFGQMLVGAAVNLVGGLVVNAIAPPREAEAPGAAAQPEPVYSLSGGANRAREYAPQLLVLGRHRVFPDLGAREYTEFRGNEQYLHQLFHFGLGNLDVSDMHIGDSPLSQYESVETQWARGTKLTLVSGNVDTESGAALDSTAWVMRTTPDSTARLGIDLVGAIFKVNRETGDILGHSAGVQIEYWPEGEPLSKRSHSVTLSNNETTPYRRTLTYTLPAAGVYTVRVRRTSKPSDDEHIHDALTFAAMRSYQPDTADYAGQTRLGLRIRATGQLFGRLERLSALVKQKIPVWDGNRWTAPQASSNPRLGVPLVCARGAHQRQARGRRGSYA